MIEALLIIELTIDVKLSLRNLWLEYESSTTIKETVSSPFTIFLFWIEKIGLEIIKIKNKIIKVLIISKIIFIKFIFFNESSFISSKNRVVLNLKFFKFLFFKK